MKILIGILLSLSVQSAFSECVIGSCTDVNITRIVATINGKTSVSTSGDESKLGCNAGNGNYITLNPDAKNYNATYSLILTAHTTGHPLWVRTNESGTCELIYAVSDK